MAEMTDRGPAYARRAERAAEAYRLREAGLGWDAVAHQLGYSVRTAERSYADHVRSGMPASIREVDVEGACVRAVVVHLEALDALREKAAARNENASVGACRSMATVSASLLDVLGRIGLLPDPALKWTLAVETRAVAREIRDACRRAGVPRDAMAAIVEATEREADRLDPGPVLDRALEVPA